MDPITLILLGCGAVWGYNRLEDKPGSEPKLPPPPRFSPDQIDQFAPVGEQGARRFDPAISRQILRLLEARSVEPLPAGKFGDKGAAAWRVTHASSSGANAARVLDMARRGGCTILASLSTVMLPAGTPAPMILLSVRRNPERLARARGHFAVLADPIRPEPKPESKPEPAPEPKPNGDEELPPRKSANGRAAARE